MIKDLFLHQVLPEVYDGEVSIATTNTQNPSIIYSVHYDSNLTEQTNSDTLVPYLNVNDTTLFFRLLEEYTHKMIENYPIPTEISKQQYLKKILALAFNNASYYDFLYPESYLETRIHFLETDFCVDKQDWISELKSLNGASIYYQITKQSMSVEAPYACRITLQRDQEHYHLPLISFGYSSKEGVCYVYPSELESLESKNDTFKQEMEHQIQSQLTTSDAFSKEESIFIFTMELFTSIMENWKMNRMKIATFLPVRFYANQKREPMTVREEVKQHKEQLKMTEELIHHLQCLEKLTHHLSLDFTNFLMTGGYIETKMHHSHPENSPLLMEIQQRMDKKGCQTL